MRMVAKDAPTGVGGGGQTRVARRAAIALAAIVGGSLAARVIYVLTVTRYNANRAYDEFYYIGQAGDNAAGHFFRTPFIGGPNALHPPLTALAVTPASWIFGVSAGATPQRLTMAVLGAAAVAIIGALGWAVAGPRVGIIAALLAAVYPNLVMPSGIVMSETVSVLLTALILLATYRLLRAPSWVSAALVGLACGVGALARAELLLCVPLLLVPAVLLARARPRLSRLRLGGVGILVAGLTIAPWVIRNLVTFQEPTFLSTTDGSVLLGANCDSTYHGPLLGAWNFQCAFGVADARDPSVLTRRQEDAAFTYIRHHAGRLPVVMAARVGRLWDVYAPFQTARTEEHEGRPIELSWAGLAMFFALVVLAVVGFIRLRRRGVPRWPLVVPVGLVTVLAAATYGVIRFRAPAEVPLVVLAAVTVDAVAARHRRAPAAENQSRTIEASSAS